MACVWIAYPAWAAIWDEKLPDAAMELRARSISQQLRCVVCQNETIDDSAAPIARDMRRMVRERIAMGDSDGDIIDYMVQRYGEFVLLKPRFDGGNSIIWLAPFLVLACAGGVLFLRMRRR